MKTLYIILISLFFGISLWSCNEDEEGIMPNTRPEMTYKKIDKIVVGFPKDMVETDPVIKKISDQLITVASLIPNIGIEKISSDTIWVSEEKNRGNGYSPLDSDESNFAGNILIGDKNKYLTESKADTLLLWRYISDLIYHKHLTADEKAQLYTHYGKVKSGKYGNVYHYNGTKILKDKVKNAPATKSESAYLGEILKACYAQNNYYPFTNEELERFDPEGLALVEQLFGKKEVVPNAHFITLPPKEFTQWIDITNNQAQTKEVPIDLWYGKYLLAKTSGNALDIVIVGSRFVSDSAMVQCKYIVETMTKKIPEYALKWMKDNHYRIGIIGAFENVTDLPENRAMPIWWPMTGPTYWDDRGRGYGASPHLPLMSCGEENIVYTPSSPFHSRYRTESIMVHEFAHNIDHGLRANGGYDPSGNEFETALFAAYKNAQNLGLWKGTYSMDNEAEYWAEGVQAWFNTCRMQVPRNDGSSFMLKYRHQLKDYDPTLYSLIEKYMPFEYLKGYHFDFEP
jgi:hypothetical protein